VLSQNRFGLLDISDRPFHGPILSGFFCI
jgi:hypothetical protein